jgi:hypothetical protein
MRNRRAPKAAAAILATLVVLGAGLAIGLSGCGDSGHGSTTAAVTAASRSAAPRGMFVAAAAYLGLAPSELRRQLHAGRTLAEIADSTAGRSSAGLLAALIAAGSARIEAAVASGQLPRAREAGRLARLRARILQLMREPRTGRVGAASGVDLPAAASYLGLRARQLRARLAGSTTLADIARATPGKSVSGLIGAIVAARTGKLKAAVADGRLGSARERELLAGLLGRVTASVESPLSSARRARSGATGSAGSTKGAGKGSATSGEEEPASGGEAAVGESAAGEGYAREAPE